MRIPLLLRRWNVKARAIIKILKLDLLWESSLFAWTLIGAFALWSYWYCSHTPSPGKAVAWLATAAAVMSLREGASGLQKSAWMLVIGAFLFVETRAIDKDRADAKKDADDRQEKSLRLQAEGFKKMLETNQAKFDATMKTMRGLAFLSSENIKTVTGGDSFCYVSLTDRRVPTVTSVGRYPLYGVEVRIADVSKYRQEGKNANPFSDLMLRPGDLPVGKAWIAFPVTIPFADPDKDDFNIFIGAKNGSWTENLMMRRINGNWERAMQVRRENWPINHSGKVNYTQVCESITEKFPRAELYPGWEHTSRRSCQ